MLISLPANNKTSGFLWRASVYIYLRAKKSEKQNHFFRTHDRYFRNGLSIATGN